MHNGLPYSWIISVFACLTRCCLILDHSSLLDALQLLGPDLTSTTQGLFISDVASGLLGVNSSDVRGHFRRFILQVAGDALFRMALVRLHVLFICDDYPPRSFVRAFVSPHYARHRM